MKLVLEARSQWNVQEESHCYYGREEKSLQSIKVLYIELLNNQGSSSYFSREIYRRE